jgi:NAD(P)-dependent dehydrogenase (short-subunit alcohol dehydrogenase family)
VIGAGDYIGGEIAKKFASEGFVVFVGRRNGTKLEQRGIGKLVRSVRGLASANLRHRDLRFNCSRGSSSKVA